MGEEMIGALHMAWKAVLLFLFWVLLASGAGIAISTPSPHGMAAFVYTSFVLGVIGGTSYVIAYLAIVGLKKKQLPLLTSFLLGLSCGIVTYPAAGLIFESTLYFFPH